MLLQAIYQEIYHSAIFEWGPKGAKALQQSEAVITTAILIGCYDSADPRVHIAVFHCKMKMVYKNRAEYVWKALVN